MPLSDVRRTPRQELERASRRLTLRALEIADWPLEQPSLRALRRDWSRGVAVLRGHLRLTRWRLRRSMSFLSQVDRRASFLIGAALALVACELFSQGEPSGEGSGGSAAVSPDVPGLSKAKRTPSKQGPWAYVLPVDHGVRADGSGKGHFRAPRFHGEHNGIDLLAPIGTPVFAACEGRAMAGASRSFGRWIHLVCPVPPGLVRSGNPHASFFYAHLNESKLPHDRWVPVGKGDTLGTVGKTGNAAAASIQPHLHLELIIQGSLRAALDERHLGNDQSSVPEAVAFLRALDERCLEPHGFQPKSGALRRARRFDPFVALTCLSHDKPSFVPAPEPLEFASSAWSKFYLARGFNVDRGPDSLLLAGN